MKSDFLIALTQLAAERGLPKEIVLSAIEAALVSAYRKDSITAGQNISVKLDPGSGDVTVYVLKTVVEDVEDDQLEITLKDAQKIKADAVIGENVATDSMRHNAGRIAAQTAKQVVMQRLREAERDIVFQEFEDKEGEVFSVTIQRVEAKQLVVDMGRAEAILPISEQVPTERYRTGNKMKVLLKAVERTGKGPELIVSRADKDLLRRLFEMEVPEIFNGSVEIEAVAREAGSRSKVAVRARQDGVDPVGSCVGLRGVRIQNIVNELHGEKIDVMEWNKDPGMFIANALSPAQVLKVELNSTTEEAIAVVPERQLSLAIGKEGQNARLAARLTGWKVDIKSNVEYEAELAERAKAEAEARALQALEEPEEIIEEVAAVAEPVEVEPEVVAEAVEEEAAAEPIAAEVESQAEELVEEIADETPVEVAEELEVETAEEVEEEPEPVVEDAVEEVSDIEGEEAETEPEIPDFDISEPEPEPVAAGAERPSSLRDLPEDVWSVRRARRSAADSNEPGRIRFAEDIAGLRGGVTASRRRRRDDGANQGTQNGGNRRRNTKAGKRRR